MDLGLHNRVAVVAAASQGLGFAVALELASEGAQVAICSRSAPAIESAARRIEQSTGRKVLHSPVDVTDGDAVAAFLRSVEQAFGRVDICVTNSGGPPSKAFEEMSPADWKSATDQLLMSTVFFARETLPRMKKNSWGRFLTITSVTVKQPIDGLLLSNSLRAAVTGLARTLANEYGPFGITVNNVCPGYTRTSRLDELAGTLSARSGVKPEEIFANWARQIPAGRVGTPEEFAAAVAFLASERASFINGISLAVDGGMVRSLL